MKNGLAAGCVLGVAMREDVCVPSVEQKYKEVIRNPAGGATIPK